MTHAAERAMKRDVWLLFACQALMSATVIGQVAMGSLIGFSLAADKAMATLPLAVQQVGMLCASIPAGIIFARLGRRAGFLLGTLASFAGLLGLAYGVWIGDFWSYTAAALPLGLGFGIAQHFRFAAAEVASPAYRPRAIALVMAGGIVSAAFGPELVKHTKDVATPYLFLGTYLILAAMPVLCAAVLTVVRLPPPPPRQASPTPVGEILRRPAFLVAAITGAMAYGTMNLLMTSTPLEMMACGFAVTDSATVIQLHAMAMFAPGFVTGRLIGRYGTAPVVAAGTALTALCVAVALAGQGFLHFTLALVLLGVGWNLMFVGATTMLAQAHRPEERVRAQAMNDLIVFGTVACTALASGAVHARAGWDVLNLLLLPALLLALVATLRHRRAARPA